MTTTKLIIESGAGTTGDILSYDSTTNKIGYIASPSSTVDIENIGTGNQLVTNPGTTSPFEIASIQDDSAGAGSGTTAITTSDSGDTWIIASNNTIAQWNANQLQGNNLDSSTPSPGNVLMATETIEGTQWTVSQGILYQVEDTSSPGGNIVYQIGSADETLLVECEQGAGIGVVTNAPTGEGEIIIYAENDQVIIGGATALTLSSTGGDVILELSNNLQIQNLNPATASSVLFFDPLTNYVTYGTAPAGGGITALTGDVTATGPGSAPATVAKIQGHSVSATAPTAGQSYIWSGSTFAPTTQTVTLTGSATGTATMNSSGLTSIATSVNALNSATTVINVSSATAPTAGQVLTATSSTAANWETLTPASKAAYLVAAASVPITIDGTGTSTTTTLQTLTIPANTVVNLGAQIEFGSVGQFVVAALDTIVISTYFGSTLVQTYSRTAGASTEAHQYSIKSTFELVNTTPGASEAYALTIFTDSGFTPAPIIEQSFTFVTGINLAASHTFSTTVTLVSSSSLITDYYSSAKAWPI